MSVNWVLSFLLFSSFFFSLQIRCSGFDSSQDGRCSNCVRFNQECMFTPVSSQAQAFVPAHAAYPHLRGGGVTAGRPGNRAEGVVLYGAHGQPLPPTHASQPPHQPGLPPPPAMYQQPQYVPQPPPPQGPIDDRGPPPPLARSPAGQDDVSRKRPRVEDDASVYTRSESLPLLQRVNHGRSRSYEYMEGPPTLPPVSTAVPGASYPPPPSSTAQGPYYHQSPTQDRHPYPYDNRSSSSPSGANLPYPPVLHPPPRDSNLNSGASGRSGLSVREMLGPVEGQSARSSTDSDMLNALNRRV